jgi:hypothetical protein
VWVPNSRLSLVNSLTEFHAFKVLPSIYPIQSPGSGLNESSFYDPILVVPFLCNPQNFNSLSRHRKGFLVKVLSAVPSQFKKVLLKPVQQLLSLLEAPRPFRPFIHPSIHPFHQRLGKGVRWLEQVVVGSTLTFILPASKGRSNACCLHSSIVAGQLVSPTKHSYPS